MHTLQERVINQEFSPEFACGSVSDLTPEVIDYCVVNGAAKVSGVFDAEAISRLGVRISNYTIMKHKFPELKDLSSFVKSGLEQSGKVRPVIDIDPTHYSIVAGRDLGHTWSHIDDNARTGISALIPVSGPPAVFGAQNTRFNNRYEKSGPRLLWQYGVGDMMLIRQGIKYFRGRRINKPQVHHFGFSEGARKLLMVDFMLDETKR